MNRRHPIDDLFRRRLENHSVEPPMHLWERIEESRRRAGIIAAPSKLSGFLIAACTAATLLIPRSEWRVEEIAPNPTPVQATAALAPVSEADIIPPPEVITEAAVSQYQKPATALDSPIAPYRQNAPATGPTGKNHAISYDTPQEDTGSIAGNTGALVEESFSRRAESFPSAPIPTRSDFRLLTRTRNFPEASKCATFGKIGLRLHVELTASPDLAMRQLEPRGSTSEDAAYAQMRERSEQPDFSYSFGARIAASTRFGLTLRSGFNYTQINERLRYVTETEERFTIINIIGPGGQITGVDTLYETIHREHTIQNRYRSIDIPVLAGYEFPVNRWLLSAHGGILINMLFRQQGSMYLPEGEMPVSFASLEQEGTPAFRNRLGIGWYAGAGVAFKIRHNLQIMAEPHLRAYPKSFTTAQFATKQSYTQAGLAIGLRYQI